MSAQELLDLAHAAGVVVSLVGDELELLPVADESQVPAALVRLCREHKPMLIEALEYQRKADAALLESTRRLAVAWPGGCELDSKDWQTLEARLHTAYWSGDLRTLEASLAARESYALNLFAKYRSEVHHA